MQVRANIRTLSDTITPDLRKKLDAVGGAARARLLEQIGIGLVSMAKRSFATDTTLRPSPWASKKDGSASTLQKSTTLRRSIRSAVQGKTVVISSSTAYASIHQMGGQTKAHTIRPKNKKALAFGGMVRKSVKHPGSKIPPRPFLPFYKDGSLTTRAMRTVTEIVRRAVEKK